MSWLRPVSIRFSRLFIIALFLSISLVSSSSAEWIDLGAPAPAINLIESGEERSVIEMTIGGFETIPVEIDGETYYQIKIDQGGHEEQVGLPDLPDVRCSMIIPDQQDVKVTFISGDYIDYPNLPIAPARGPISREVDPATVPFTFDPCYQGTDVQPSELAGSLTPYILRDYRGAVIEMNAFSYFPATRTLRVYTRMLVEVTVAGSSSVNIIDRLDQPTKVDTQFASIYANHFINYQTESRYTPVSEDGSLLIITPDEYIGQAMTLREWKTQKGLSTRVATLSETGSSYSNIKSYIQNLYNTTDLAYVLLFGDAEDLVPMNGDEDPSYSLLAGSDNYPEIFIGRFSAENATQLNTQVQRTITYERDLSASDTWIDQGTGVASNISGGHGGQSDDTHLDAIREDYLAYTYSLVDQIYDPYATSAMVTTAINDGRSIVNYTGHGLSNSWDSSGFTSTHVNALANVNKLPLVYSVACYNGSFIGGSCFAEAWLRATDGGEPTGAIAAYMSVISQSWVPPMDAQDEAADLLVGDEMRTIGGICFNSSCMMMDLNTSQGPLEFKAWTVFGDPSLNIRTDDPTTMMVSHPDVMFLGQDAIEISIPGVTGALCALTADGEILGTGYTDGAGNLSMDLDVIPSEPITSTLTVTAYNRVTYIDSIEWLPPSGPYLVVDETEFLIDGFRTGDVQAGQSILLRVMLTNVGVENAINISSTLSGAPEGITLTQATSNYPDIMPDGSAWNEQLFAFDVASDCPDGMIVNLSLDSAVTGTDGFESAVTFIVHAPAISISEMVIDDTAGGNGDYRLDPGETATIGMTLLNSGSGTLNNIGGELICTHPQIQITSASATHAGLGQNDSGQLAPLFEVTVDEAFTAFEGNFVLALSGDLGYDTDFEFLLPIGGYYENVEGGAPGWSHYVVSGTFTDQWHVSTTRNHTPNGTQSWKCGAQTSGDYASLLDAGLETLPASVDGEVELRFWMWMDSETSSAYPDRAYDGGIIEMSIDDGPFEQITPVGGYTHTIRPGGTPGPFPDTTPVFAGSIDWREVSCLVGEISGSVVFRFRFGSDGASGGEGWYIDDVEVIGLANLSDTEDRSLPVTVLSLSNAQPNPFTASSRISFAIPTAEEASLKVFDATGRLVKTLVSGTMTPGTHHVAWDGSDDNARPAPSGLYYYRLVGKSGEKIRPVVLMR